MRAFLFSVIWIFLNFASFIVRGDTEIFCLFGQSCVLPCTFQPGEDAVIHWIQTTPKNPNIQVHSYYYNKDQLGLQNPSFKGRTLLFNDLIAKGNASLKLSGINLQDEGRYKCYTSTITGNKELFIILKVYAPVQTVQIEKKNNIITCRSDEVYPEPDLTWDPSPPSPPVPKKDRTGKGLYSISSSVTVSDTDLDYSCTVSTSKNKKKNTLFKQANVNRSGSEATIPCGALISSQTSLTWTFSGTQLILTRHTPEDLYVSEEWEKYVKSVSETGRLTLKDLSSKQDGVYTCELSNTEETSIKHTDLQYVESDEHKTAIINIAIPVITAIVLVGLIVLGLYLRKKGWCQVNTEHSQNSEKKISRSSDLQKEQSTLMEKEDENVLDNNMAGKDSASNQHGDKDGKDVNGYHKPNELNRVEEQTEDISHIPQTSHDVNTYKKN